MTTSPNLIKSVDRALAILDALATEGESGVSLSDIGRRVGINPSTAHHLLATLMNRHVVEQDPASRRYRLGIHVIELGNSARATMSLAHVATSYVEDLAKITDQTVSVLTFHGLLRVPMLLMQSGRRLSAQFAPLEISTLHATGSGKLLLAFLPHEEFQEYLNRVRLERFTSTTITDADVLVQEMSRIRAEGIAQDLEEYGPGVQCIAVPIRDSTLRVVGCIDLVFPTFGLTDECLQEWMNAARQCASELSTQLQNIGVIVSYSI